LERQIPSLHDFVDRRIMTVAEVKSLVEQRRNFEYRLARQAARKVLLLSTVFPILFWIIVNGSQLHYSFLARKLGARC
jgi:hypothetical protein